MAAAATAVRCLLDDPIRIPVTKYTLPEVVFSRINHQILGTLFWDTHGPRSYSGPPYSVILMGPGRILGRPLLGP